MSQKCRLLLCLSFCLGIFPLHLKAQDMAMTNTGAKMQERSSENQRASENSFRMIEKKFRISIAYKSDLVMDRNIAIDPAKYATVGEALDALLKDSGLKYKKVSSNFYTIIKDDAPKDVAAKKPLQPGNARIVNPAPELVLKGDVIDAGGNAVPGATVSVKGTQIGTITNAEGAFSLTIPEKYKEGILTITSIGYDKQEVEISGRTSFKIQLESSNSALSEVVVIGYGTQKKVNLTGAIAQVDGTVLANKPVTNVGQALQGVIPNLNITNSSGNPNASPGINIRGTTSLSSGGSPLVLVDGIQMDLNLLNPVDIQSITVLKDAASCAIYGARGAFGVILVTTKSGSYGKKTQLSYAGSIQYNRPTYLPDLLGPLDYVESQNVASVNATGSQKYTDDAVKWIRDYLQDPVNNPDYHTLPNGKIFWNHGNDVFKLMLQPWAPGQNHSLNVSGGNSKTTYYLSGGYLRQEGMFRTSTDIFQRYNFTSNLSTNVTDWLKVGVKASYIRTGYNEPNKYVNKGSDWWEQMTRGEPQILYPVSTPEGSPVGAGVPTENFLNFLNSGSRVLTNGNTGVYGINGEAQLLKGLKLKGDFSYTSFRQDIKSDIKTFGYIRDTWQTQTSGTSPSYVQRNFNQSDYFAGNIYVNYNTIIAGKHSIAALAGYNQEWNNSLSTTVRRQDLISSGIPAVGLATGLQTTSDDESAWAIRGIFARLNYSYADKYLVEFNSRYDGTSKFPEGNRFGFFPSVSAGWRISQENFMKPLAPVLSDLKLRASYGSLGNQNVSGNYPYIPLFGITQQVPYLINGVLPLGITAPGLVSSDLTWEKVSTLDFGTDVNLWEKLDVSFDWYKRITSGMLIAGDKSPAVLGIAVPQRNGAQLQTKGFELSLKWHDEISHQLKYDVGVMLSDYKAEITKFNNNPNKLITTYYVGQEVGEIWGFETAGIFQNADEVAKAAKQNQLGNGDKWGPGDIQYKNLDGNTAVISRGAQTVSDPGDQRIIGNSTPRYQFGIMGNLYWKNFDLSLMLQGVGKKDVYPGGAYFWGADANGAAVGTNEVYHDSWTTENTGAYYPIYKAGSSYNILTQTRYLQNAAYIRLKNIAIGYSLPPSVLQRIKLTQLRIYFSGQNLWEYTRLKGNFDPEITSGDLGVFYPLQRAVSFGVQLSL